MRGHMQPIVGMLPSSLVLLMLFAGCNLFRPSHEPTPPPPSIQNPPIYSGAQAIDIRPNQNGVETHISFASKDEPDAILKYYDDLLLREGWKPKLYQNAPPDWTYYVFGDGPWYYFSLKVDRTLNNLTNVELILTIESLIG